MNKKNIIKIVISVLIAALTALGAAFGLRDPHHHHTKPVLAER